MDTEVFEPVQTPLGILSGRDAIYLDHVQCSVNPLKLVLIGSFNGMLASELPQRGFYDYSLTFVNVQAFQTIELDLMEYDSQSSFDQVLHSQWLSRLQQRDAAHSVPQTIIATCKHYRLWTYDYVFNVICSEYELAVQLDNPHTS
jgi:hypothetical protein